MDNKGLEIRDDTLHIHIHMERKNGVNKIGIHSPQLLV